MCKYQLLKPAILTTAVYQPDTYLCSVLCLLLIEACDQRKVGLCDEKVHCWLLGFVLLYAVSERTISL